MVMNNHNKTALITGASGGIGYELAKLFARDHYDLVLVARSKEKLDQLADELGKKFGIAVTVIAKDLASPSAPEELFAEVQQASINIDVLVNNAGYATYGPFVKNDLKVELDMMQVNMMALTHLTKLFLSGMIERHEGKILNVASTASFQPGPLMAVYYASKAYVLSLSEALANELQGTGVIVTALCPGPTRTGFQDRAGLEGGTRLLRGIMDVRPVAIAGYRALMRGQRVIIPGRVNWLFAESVRFGPRKLITQIVRYMQERGH